MTTDPPDEGLGIVAVDEEELESVYHNGDELNLLKTKKSKMYILSVYPPSVFRFIPAKDSIDRHS